MNLERLLPTTEELALLSWLNAIPRVGPAAARLLLAHYQTPRAVFEARNYQEVDGLKPPVIKELTQASKTLDAFLRKAEAVLVQARALNIAIITPLTALYPPQLLTPTTYSPTVLYVAGDPACLSLPSGAIVGTRSPSVEARERTRTASRHLVQNRLAVVSGMAKGVDAEAHRGALEADGKTVAVLGCGVDRTYPVENAELYKQIRETGAVISEYAPGTPPSPENLRRRNRLIVALSNVVVVAECPVDSGAMIAARAALQQHRPIVVLNLNQPGFARERGGTDLLVSTELAARWDGENVEWLEWYRQTWRRPPSAESRLDKALGKPARSATPKSSSARLPKVHTKASRRQTTPTEEKDLPAIRPTAAMRSRSAPRPHATARSSESNRHDTTPTLPAMDLGSGGVSVPEGSAAPALVKGQRVRHPTFGIGTIQAIRHGQRGYLEIKFDKGGVKKIGLHVGEKLDLLME